VYTLEEGISRALKQNWTFKALEEKISQAMNLRKQARSDFLPTFKTQYSYTGLDEVSNYGSSSIKAKDNYQWRSSVSQPLFAGFGLVGAYKYARLGEDQSRVEIEMNKLDLALQVKEAYFNILIADKVVEVAQKEVESLSSNVEITNHFYKNGMIPINDLLKAELELANARQNLVAAKNGSRLARSSFNIILARPVNEPVDVEDILEYKSEEIVFLDAIDRAIRVRPEIKFADIGIQKAQEQITMAKSGYYPSIDLSFDYIKEGDDAEVSGSSYHDPDRWQVAAMCSWTLFEWGKTCYNVKQKKSAADELTKKRKAIEENISLEVQEAILNLETAEKNIPTTKKAVLQGEENLRVNEEGYRAKVSTVTDVLDAQSLLTQARVNYYKALYGQKLAKARLLRAMGTF
jgi:outer membrane protein TolC